MENQPLKVLVVDDEKTIRHFLRASLCAYQHTVWEAETGDEAISKVYNARPDLVILDLGLPDQDGIDVIREIRAFSQVPIIILSVRNREQDKINALDAGADDYLVKPFGVGELLARMRGVIRRVNLSNDEVIFQVGQLKMDIEQHLVFIGNEKISLTPTEFDLLRLFMNNVGKVLTHRHIIDRLWGTHIGEEARLLRVNISNLRHKIEQDLNNPQYIQTELGVGYRMADEDLSP